MNCFIQETSLLRNKAAGQDYIDYTLYDYSQHVLCKGMKSTSFFFSIYEMSMKKIKLPVNFVLVLCKSVYNMKESQTKVPREHALSFPSGTENTLTVNTLYKNYVNAFKSISLQGFEIQRIYYAAIP